MAVKKSAPERKTNTTEKAVNTANKSANKKTAAKKTTAKKTTAGKTADKKTAVKKTVSKKTAEKKTAAVKKTAKKTEQSRKSSAFVASSEITVPGFSKEGASFLSGNDCFYNRELSWL